MLIGLLVALVSPLVVRSATAAESWTAPCPTRDDPSMWFVFAAAPDVPPLTEFDCQGLFFDSTLSCTQTIGIGKVRPNGASPGGSPLVELRYLPYGDKTGIIGFLSRLEGGVLYKPPAAAAPTSHTATPAPSTASQLFELYLNQRNKASAATANVALHVWTCPDAPFVPPTAAIEPFGMKLVQHVGKVSMY